MTAVPEDPSDRPSAPLTRRQALAQEREVNTGVIPQVVVTQQPERFSSPTSVAPQPVVSALASPEPVAPETAVVPPAESRSLTRRELRAMRQAHETTRSSSDPSADISQGIVTATPTTATPLHPGVVEDLSEQPRVWPLAGINTSPVTPITRPTAVDTTETSRASLEVSVPDRVTPVERINDVATSSLDVSVTSGGSATHALILPSIPHPDMTAPLGETGEVLLTGSIDLPRGFGTLGAHPARIDTGDVDDQMVEAEVGHDDTAELAPVRASQAVSSQPNKNELVAPPKKQSAAVPVVLMVTAGVLALGVTGLLVAAYVLHIL